jgi:hypothetical protein
MLEHEDKISELAQELKELADRFRQAKDSVKIRELLREFRITLKRADRLVLEQSCKE